MTSLPPSLAPFRLLLAALLLIGTVAQAQAQTPAPASTPPDRSQRRAERVGQLENAKIAFLTSRLSLSQEQAQRFWPLYNEFTAKRRDLNRTGRQLRQPSTATPTLTDQQVRDHITQSFALRQQELNLEKDYFERFQKVLSVQQVGQLFQAEHDFTREIIKRVAGPGRPARR